VSLELILNSLQQSNSTPPSPYILGVVLAGGQSSRMNVDKATLEINGVSNLNRALDTLQKCLIDEVVVSGSHLQNKHIQDRYPNGGPLSGIFSVLLEMNQTKQPLALLVVPVDMPLITPSLLNSLIENGLTENTACCYKSYNLPMFLPVTSLLLEFLTNEFLSERFTRYNKGPSFNHLLKHINCQFIEPLNADLLANANTPQQWHKINQLFD